MIRPRLCTSKYSQKDILGSRLIACCKLTPTLARQMWRHNYVIGRNEYLIFTYSESTVKYCSLGIFTAIFVSVYNTHHLWEIWKKMLVGVFFWTQCIDDRPTTDLSFGKIQITISPQRIIRSTSCLVLRWFFVNGGSNGAIFVSKYPR